MVELGANLNQLGMQTFPLGSCQAKASIKSDPKSIEWMIQNNLQGDGPSKSKRFWYFVLQSQTNSSLQLNSTKVVLMALLANEGF